MKLSPQDLFIYPSIWKVMATHLRIYFGWDGHSSTNSFGIGWPFIYPLTWDRMELTYVPLYLGRDGLKPIHISQRHLRHLKHMDVPIYFTGDGYHLPIDLGKVSHSFVYPFVWEGMAINLPIYLGGDGHSSTQFGGRGWPWICPSIWEGMALNVPIYLGRDGHSSTQFVGRGWP